MTLSIASLVHHGAQYQFKTSMFAFDKKVGTLVIRFFFEIIYFIHDRSFLTLTRITIFMIDKKAKLNLDLMSCKNAASMLVKMMVTFFNWQNHLKTATDITAMILS